MSTFLDMNQGVQRILASHSCSRSAGRIVVLDCDLNKALVVDILYGQKPSPFFSTKNKLADAGNEVLVLRRNFHLDLGIWALYGGTGNIDKGVMETIGMTVTSTHCSFQDI